MHTARRPGSTQGGHQGRGVTHCAAPSYIACGSTSGSARPSSLHSDMPLSPRLRGPTAPGASLRHAAWGGIMQRVAAGCIVGVLVVAAAAVGVAAAAEPEQQCAGRGEPASVIGACADLSWMCAAHSTVCAAYVRGALNRARLRARGGGRIEAADYPVWRQHHRAGRGPLRLGGRAHGGLLTEGRRHQPRVFRLQLGGGTVRSVCPHLLRSGGTAHAIGLTGARAGPCCSSPAGSACVVRAAAPSW